MEQREQTVEERIAEPEMWLYGPLEAASDELEELYKQRDGDGPDL